MSHRSESGKFAKRPNENLWYGPEKTVERHLKSLRRCFLSSSNQLNTSYHTTIMTRRQCMGHLLKLHQRFRCSLELNKLGHLTGCGNADP